MNKSLRSLRSGALLGMVLLATGAFAQGNCLNPDQYPFGGTTPNPGGTVTTITTCNFPGEYSEVVGIVPGGNYEFTASEGAYITLRSGTPGGPVVAQGSGTVQYLAVSADPLYPHFNTDSNCGTESTCLTTTVQFLLNCTPITASFVVQPDCDNDAFFVSVTISGLGDATSVDIENDGGAPVIAEVGVGTYSVGPFSILDAVQIYVRHDLDELCSVLSPVMINTYCPITVECGVPAIADTYCYGPNEEKTWAYTSDGSGTMRLTFLRGTIESGIYDRLTIYDGSDITAPILFENTGLNSNSNLGPAGSAVNNALVDYYAVDVFATGSDLFMTLTSEGYADCSTNTTFDPFEWEVVCLNCSLPMVGASVVDDCENGTFTIPVTIGSTGSGASVNVVYTVDQGAATVIPGQGIGQIVLGPFNIAEVVNVVVEHEDNALCNVDLGDLTDTGLCPRPIVCGASAVEETYCYGPSENKSWGYQSDGGGTMRLTFLRGTIESGSYDRLTIYDGSDNTAPVLFTNVGVTSTYNLGPVGSAVNNALVNFFAIDVFATGNDLFMTLTSETSVHCSTSTTFDPFEWEVVCLNCTLPVVGASVVDDCENGTFTIPVTIGSTGSGASVNLVYTVDQGAATVIPGQGVGQVELGPFNIGEVVNVMVEHEDNALCNVDLGNLTDTGMCPSVIICGDELNVVFCPVNYENNFSYYRGEGAFPLGLLFNSGLLESCCDRLYVYDGGDDTAPLLTPVGGIGGDLTGLFFLSTNAENRLTVRVTTDVSGSCGTGGSYAPLDYTLSCLDCVPPSVAFEIVQDCANYQYFVDVVVTVLGSDEELDLSYTNEGNTLSMLVNATGTFQIGPFGSGTITTATLVNDANSLCSVASGNLVNPLCPLILCGAQVVEEEYCYVANDSRAWAYELPSNGTLRLTFLRGTIESSSFDRVRIYDGPSNTSPLLFEHNNTTTWNLGPVGSAVNNTITNFYAVDVSATGSNLYMEMSSDGSVSCATSTNFDPWEWIVFCDGCEIPGVTYTTVANCFDRSYVMEVGVTDAGVDGLRVVNTFSGEEQVATAPGTLSFGPFAHNAPVAFELTALDNLLCSYYSDTLTYDSENCVIVSCGVDNYSHCYGNDEDRWYTFRSALSVPTTIAFSQGQMLTGDRIVIYNGRNESAQVLYQGNNGGNLAGLAVNSQNVDNVITLRIQSNSTGSCSDGGASAELRWDVACGAVGVEEMGGSAFTVYPNPTSSLLYVDMGKEVSGKVNLRIIDISGQVVLEQQFAGQDALRTIDMEGLTSGHYLVQLTTAGWVKTQRVEVVR